MRAYEELSEAAEDWIGDREGYERDLLAEGILAIVANVAVLFEKGITTLCGSLHVWDRLWNGHVA